MYAKIHKGLYYREKHMIQLFVFYPHVICNKIVKQFIEKGKVGLTHCQKSINSHCTERQSFNYFHLKLKIFLYNFGCFQAKYGDFYHSHISFFFLSFFQIEQFDKFLLNFFQFLYTNLRKKLYVAQNSQTAIRL